MVEHPICMSLGDVRALIAGTKTMHRLVVDPQPVIHHWQDVFMMSPKNGRARFRPVAPDWPDGDDDDVYFPLGQPGDRLWVREPFAKVDGQTRPWIETDYLATYTHGDRLGDLIGIEKHWTPSIEMPREASRITLEIADMRVERLQEISRGDAMAEGCPFPNMAQGDDPRQWYAQSLEDTNCIGSWNANPWVWVLSLNRCQQ